MFLKVLVLEMEYFLQAQIWSLTVRKESVWLLKGTLNTC